MLKSHRIDINNIDGSQCDGVQIEVQGSMDVMPIAEPLEGVHESSLFMSLDTAHELVQSLSSCLAEARENKGWRPKLK